jgi:hypothetical protein
MVLRAKQYLNATEWPALARIQEFPANPLAPSVRVFPLIVPAPTTESRGANWLNQR